MGRGRAKAKQASLLAVPDLRGLTVTEAEVAVARLDLVVVGPDGSAAEQLRGSVVGQQPAPGAPVPRHGQVTVWTSGPGGESGVREPLVPPVPRRGAGAEADPEERPR